MTSGARLGFVGGDWRRWQGLVKPRGPERASEASQLPRASHFRETDAQPDTQAWRGAEVYPHGVTGGLEESARESHTDLGLPSQ